VERLGRRVGIQIFGTDLDARGIEVARAGRYPEGIAADLGEERLRRFFLKEERHYRIKKDIRDLAIFAVQDVLRDPPFTRVDLISCRNLLIYLTADAQKRLLPMFHYSLNRGGFLMLGSSESATGFEGLFDAVDRRWKLYRRKESGATIRPMFELAARAADARESMLLKAPGKIDLADILRRHLATNYAPPAVIIDEKGQIEQIHGRTGLFLEPAPGKASLNVVEMARDGLRTPLGAAIRQILTTDAPEVRKTTRVRTNGEVMSIRLSIRRLLDPKIGRLLLVITFEPEEGAGSREAAKPMKPNRKTVGLGSTGQLEEELRTTRSDLQSTIEELQATNEELASANEEVQSVNEELQSSNEELQTSKEEAQSLNEELQTVNAELEAKLQSFEEANDDLLNLINSTDIAMIFLDNQLHVKRFTPAAQSAFHLIDADVGRPLADLRSSLEYPDLLADAERVLESLMPLEKEVRASDG
ncbi:MAG TPA: hypothetical protein DEP35_03210, partial [Deltaproteobacteria bacterium]|nr:hypothetical protein [Deltaproteobacteria bacterium]